MAIVIWKEPIATKYVASLLSWPFALRFVVFCCNIIFAFLIAYGTEDLWVRETSHFEQPQADFDGSSLFLLHELQGSTFFASSGTAAAHLFPSSTIVPNISVSRTDSNDDGKIDKLTITSSFPLPAAPSSASFRAADMVLGISYSISSRTRFALRSSVAVHAAHPLHACALTISANLVLNQINAIPYATRSVINISAPALSSSQALSSASVDFTAIAAALAQHNYSTTLSNRVDAWQRCPSGSSSSFVVTLDLRIAPQLLRVQTALMTVIKFGWIQFICIYFLLWWASEHFLRFLFVHKVVPVRHVAPGKLHSD